MALWILMAVLTALAASSLLVPLYRNPRARRPEGEEKQAIYRDQLDEIERDLARGVIAESEAEAARTEISRRLLHASESVKDSVANSGDISQKLTIIVAAGVMPVMAIGLYLHLGDPQFSEQPASQQAGQPNASSDIGDVIARVETHLKVDPDDGRGWALLGPVYTQLGRYDDAIDAFMNALRILGPDVELEADLGEAITRKNGNLVTAEARAAFERARALDENAIRPRFFLAVALSQDGRNEEAIVAWRNLLVGAPPNAPWAMAARAAIAQLGGQASGAPGPNAADVEAAEKLTPGERMGMIGGMVESLAQRLESAPDDAEGWARLIRSYMVLDRKDEAVAALAKAQEANAADAEKLAIIKAEARALGLMN